MAFSQPIPAAVNEERQGELRYLTGHFPSNSTPRICTN